MTGERLTEKECTYSDAVYEGNEILNKALFALEELMECYGWDVEPSPQKAMKYIQAPPAQRELICDLADKASYKLLVDYKRMMWLVDVAFDYCRSCSEELKKVLDL